MRAQDSEYLAALERERVGYERRGDAERLAAVDAEIARIRGTGRQDRLRQHGARRRGSGE